MGRYDVAVEAALYFCCLEAVQNAGKHSNAQHVTIDLADDRGHLVLTVEDDGAGFTGPPPTPGVGLANMRDRVEALGGTLRIEATGTGGARCGSPSAVVRSSRGLRVALPGPDRCRDALHMAGATRRGCSLR